MTLIEVMVVLLIIMIVMAGVSATVTTSQSSQSEITDQNETQKQAQKAIDVMIDSMRGFSQVELGEIDQVMLSQRDKDGVLIRTAIYYLQGDQLVRDRFEALINETVTGEWICGNDPVRIVNLEFSYYKLNVTYDPYNAEVIPASPTEAQSLLASITVTSGNNTATETSWVKFRNKHITP